MFDEQVVVKWVPDTSVIRQCLYHHVGVHFTTMTGSLNINPLLYSHRDLRQNRSLCDICILSPM